MKDRVEVAKEQPEEFVMPGESGHAQPVADLRFVKDHTVGYLLYRAETRNGHTPKGNTPKGNTPGGNGK
jgi:hypothetical protein